MSAREKLLKFHKGWLHPELVPHIEGIAKLVDTFTKIDFLIPDINDLPEEQINALAWLYTRPSFAKDTAFSIPILHPDICDQMVEYTRDKEFTSNPMERDAYKIPEYILAVHDPELFNVISDFAQISLFLIYNLYWGKYPDTVESIQLAKYTPEGTKKTQWHHDFSSNMTGLINLAPELYTGGGTDIRTSLLTFDHIPSIPKGHALIFNGNMLLHRGAEVTSGERYLLVFWVTTDRNKTTE